MKQPETRTGFTYGSYGIRDSDSLHTEEAGLTRSYSRPVTSGGRRFRHDGHVPHN